VASTGKPTLCSSNTLFDDLIQRQYLTFEEDAVEHILPEGDAQFPAGLVQAGERVAASAALVAAGSAADFLPHHMIADVAFTVIGVKRYLRPVKHQQEFGFIAVNAQQELGEFRVACHAQEDGIKPFSQPLQVRTPCFAICASASLLIRYSATPGTANAINAANGLAMGY
jgi:hypothetical protein